MYLHRLLHFTHKLCTLFKTSASCKLPSNHCAAGPAGSLAGAASSRTVYTGCSSPDQSSFLFSCDFSTSRLDMVLTSPHFSATFSAVCRLLSLSRAAVFTVKAPETEAASLMANHCLCTLLSSPQLGCHQVPCLTLLKVPCIISFQFPLPPT